MVRNYDYSVSFTRIIAMLLIIMCHIFSHSGYSALGQLFNVGVPLFFVISGYIYGDRFISTPGKWLISRYIRLVIPALIWLLIIIATDLIYQREFPLIHQCVFLILNLQGLDFIFSNMQDLFIGPWFFTNIMGCYILYIMFVQIEKKHKNAMMVFQHGGILPLCIFSLLGLFSISTDGALAFFIGFVLKRKHYLEKQKISNCIKYLATAMIAVMCRLLGKWMIDESVIYNEIIAPLTHVVLAVTILLLIKLLFYMYPIMNDVLSTRPLKHLDRISIYVYICHDMFIGTTIFSVFDLELPLFGKIAIYFPLVFITSTILWTVGRRIEKNALGLIDYLLFTE